MIGVASEGAAASGSNTSNEYRCMECSGQTDDDSSVSNRSECGVYLWVLSRHFGGYLSQLLLQRNGQTAVSTHSLQTDCSLHAYFRMLCIARPVLFGWASSAAR